MIRLAGHTEYKYYILTIIVIRKETHITTTNLSQEDNADGIRPDLTLAARIYDAQRKNYYALCVSIT